MKNLFEGIRGISVFGIAGLYLNAITNNCDNHSCGVVFKTIFTECMEAFDWKQGLNYI